MLHQLSQLRLYLRLAHPQQIILIAQKTVRFAQDSVLATQCLKCGANIDT